MGVNSLPKNVTQQRRGCDLNPGPSAPESSTLTTRLPSHHCMAMGAIKCHGSPTEVLTTATVCAEGLARVGLTTAVEPMAGCPDTRPFVYVY